MLRRLLNLPLTVASRAARAFQDREDARSREKYNTAHDPGSIHMRAGPTLAPRTGDSAGDSADTAFSMDAAAIIALLNQTPAPAFIDVRPTAAFAAGSLPGASSIPLDETGIRVSELPRDRIAIVCCEDGVQSLAATRFFRERGMEDTWVLAGGIHAWKKAGHALVQH
jgi:rhodanese-related sulfurtransferase